MNHVLVTGATGFIGRRLVTELCRQSLSVRAFVRDTGRAGILGGDGVSLHEGRVEDSSSMLGLCAGIDTVFHLAGYAHADAASKDASDLHRKITVVGTRGLLGEAIRQRVKRFVLVSSVKAQGEDTVRCIDEDAPSLPTTDYGRSRFEAECLVLAAGREAGLETCVLRLPLVYGPGQKGNLLRMMEAIDRGRFPPLPDTGNQRSLVHVDDVVQALVLAATQDAAVGKTYYVTDNRPYTTTDLYRMMRRALGRPEPRWLLPLGTLRLLARMGDLGQSVFRRGVGFDSEALKKLTGTACYRCDRIMRDLGYRPTRTLEGALLEIIDAYKAGLGDQY